MSSTKTKKIIEQFLQHLAGRNLPELLALFSEKIDWYVPGDVEKVPWLGRRKNKEELREFYELLWNSIEPLSAQINNVFIESNAAVISGEFSTKMLETSKIVDSLFFIQITVENDLIIKYRLLEDSYAVSVALTNSSEKER